jgi:hypothetical protein
MHISLDMIINSRQYGFRSLHSTVTALLDLTNQWYYNIDRGMVNGVLFLDETKDDQILQCRKSAQYHLIT